MNGTGAVESVMSSFARAATARADEAPAAVVDAPAGAGAGAPREAGFAEQLGSQLQAVEAAATGPKGALAQPGTATLAKDAKRRKTGADDETAEAQAMAAALQLQAQQASARPYEAHVPSGPEGVERAVVAGGTVDRPTAEVVDVDVTADVATMTEAGVAGAGVGRGAIDASSLGLTAVKEHLASAEIAEAMLRAVGKPQGNPGGAANAPRAASPAHVPGRSDLTPAPRMTPELGSATAAAERTVLNGAAPMAEAAPEPPALAARLGSDPYASGAFPGRALGQPTDFLDPAVTGPSVPAMAAAVPPAPLARGMTLNASRPGAGVNGTPPLRPTAGRATSLRGAARSAEPTRPDMDAQETAPAPAPAPAKAGLTTPADQSPLPEAVPAAALALPHGADASGMANVNVMTADSVTAQAGQPADGIARAVENAEAVGHRRVLAGDAHGALSVEDLGRFEVRARTHEDGRVDVQVQAEHRQGAALLDAHAAELRADVRAEVPRAQVHVGSHGSSGADTAAGSFARSGQRDGDSQGRDARPGRTAEAGTVTPSTGASTDRRSSRVRIVL
ncbi:MAG: hypothetical protein JWP97_6629 [Labilithrix sp.]|nr:hypothetical protein [Labilithrix sp.]